MKNNQKSLTPRVPVSHRGQHLACLRSVGAPSRRVSGWLPYLDTGSAEHPRPPLLKGAAVEAGRRMTCWAGDSEQGPQTQEGQAARPSRERSGPLHGEGGAPGADAQLGMKRHRRANALSLPRVLEAAALPSSFEMPPRSCCTPKCTHGCVCPCVRVCVCACKRLRFCLGGSGNLATSSEHRRSFIDSRDQRMARPTGSPL